MVSNQEYKMKTYRIGILGFGMIGKVHAYAYAAMPFYSKPMNAAFRITHVATAHQETAERAKAMCGAEITTTDYRQITENPNIDIVHICTPNDLHAEALLSAIAHRKKIYCDKPLAASLDETKQIQTALNESNYAETNQMTFHLRFFPALIRAKKILDEGTLGRILQFRIGFFHSSNASASLPFKWKHTKSGGAGLAAGNCSGLLD